MIFQYLYNSGFLVEFEKTLVIIDYYRDQSVIDAKRLLKADDVYVLSSHGHSDHFNPVILDWCKGGTITYLFSKDILESQKASENQAHYLSKGDEYSDGILTVKAFGSTDEGISFLIHLGGKSIFHAGDLNNWHWAEESTAEESQEYEEHFLSELKEIAQETKSIDVVMFPIDPRLGNDYMRGAKQFLEQIRTGLFIPMHFGDHFNKANAFESYALNKGSHFGRLTTQGQYIYI